MLNVGKYYGHLKYFTAIGYFLGSLGRFCAHLVVFSILVRCSKNTLATLVEKKGTKP
jgi:hypothetical protein